MIDFKNSIFLQQDIVDNDTFQDLIDKILVDGEFVIITFQGYRDGIVFTNKRIITINIQGATGKKKDLTSIPYGSIQAYSVETAGGLDFDSELTLWIPSAGSIKLQFTRNTDVFYLCQTISEYTLK